MAISLTPLRDVAMLHGDTMAESRDPWLLVEGLDLAALAGHFVEIAYSASFWDLPARPVFRFTQADGTIIERIASGPVVGRGFWTGRLPHATRTISVSPTNQIGRFDFRIDAIRPRTTLALLAEGMRRNRRSTRSAILTRLIGWRPESDVNLMWAIGSEPLSAYGAWARRRERPREPDQLDRPRIDWQAARPIDVFITGDEDARGLAQTLESLKTQSFPRWRARLASPADPLPAPCVAQGAGVDPAADPAEADLSVLLPAGRRLRPDALAMVAELAARHPQARLVYGDAAIHVGGQAGLDARPGWSPRLYAARPYIGTAFVRDVSHWSGQDRHHWLRSGDLPATFAAALRPDDVVPLRRVLIDGETFDSETRDVALASVPETDARVSIIIPTRDQPALLRRVVASIRARSAPGRYELIVVDNGSVDAETVALLASLRDAADTRVVAHPGAFNFSLMCNEASAVAAGAVLLFMNDDMDVLSDGWLDRLAALATQPDVGAVGAKLTYPDGRLQHVGVLVGMGESAGHFGSLVAGDDVGWAARNHAVHEVSAVTGACLAVARDKFDAVGGFDAAHLPIELSDIDLCLKLNARGWQTLVDPFVHLMHEESVSRGGATFRRLDVYGGERAVFIDRWRHMLRDDPTFHPGLSLYRWQAALG